MEDVFEEFAVANPFRAWEAPVVGTHPHTFPNIDPMNPLDIGSMNPLDNIDENPKEFCKFMAFLSLFFPLLITCSLPQALFDLGLSCKSPCAAYLAL